MVFMDSMSDQVEMRIPDLSLEAQDILPPIPAYDYQDSHMEDIAEDELLSDEQILLALLDSCPRSPSSHRQQHQRARCLDADELEALLESLDFDDSDLVSTTGSADDALLEEE